ncbi:MAG TPA: tetratricopeptide repeat protein [Polyangiaceae bacterium]|nr:tetratricopeptide repeat protein [Polyangiaceae bacterium]
MKDGKDQPREQLELFIAATRRIHHPSTPEQRSQAWQRLQSARAARSALGAAQQARTVPRWPKAVLALAVAAALILGLRSLFEDLAPRPLEYSARQGTERVSDGTFAAPNEPGELRFSDGTKIAIRRGAQVAVGRLTPESADMRLVRGVIDVEVRPQQNNRWIFNAGPFAVHVKGTAFRLEWEPDKQGGELRMQSGVVAVTGGRAREPITVKAGQSLLLASEGAAAASSVPPPSRAVPVATPPPATSASETKPELAPSAKRAPLVRGGRDERQASEPASWSALLADGKFNQIVIDAKARGVELTLNRGSEADIAALADAARYLQQHELARSALLRLRARFPESEGAKHAAFFLGRIGEATHLGSDAILAWYERYLRESPRGPYAEGALAQQMTLLRRQQAWSRARSVAQRYLSEHPKGTYRALAASVLRDAEGK